MRVAREAGHTFFLASATKRDFEHDRDLARKAANLALVRKYSQLGPIAPQPDLLAALGETVPPLGRDSNDDIDLEQLAALWSEAVDFLVTDDIRLHRRAGRAGLGDRVFTIVEAAAYFQRLDPSVLEPPPAVEFLKAYQLDTTDAIFESLRSDYQGFDSWLRKVRSEHRPAWVVRGDAGYAAVMIAKDEDGNEIGLSGTVLKVSTFKVAQEAAGRFYGELLLKALFSYAEAIDAHNIYVTAFEKHARLIEFLEAFGFARRPEPNDRGEQVLVKIRRPAAVGGLDPLEAHRRFGPPFVHPEARLFVVPVRPHWHDSLFPELVLGFDLWLGTHPYGNALRKVYVSGARTRLVEPGDVLLFYRSDDLRAVTVVGVAEDVEVFTDPEDVRRFAGRRTVYKPDDLARMARDHGQLHTMLFRQDRLLEPVWPIRELQLRGVLNAAPQSITGVREEGREWVVQMLAESQ